MHCHRIQSNPIPSHFSPMPSNGLSVGPLNGNPASTSQINQLNPMEFNRIQGQPVLLIQGLLHYRSMICHQ